MRSLVPSVRLIAWMTLVLGVGYPLLVTVVARVAFPHQAAGSLVVVDGEARGSALIGQPFDGPGYFWGRPSMTSPAFNAAASAGPQHGPTHPLLRQAIAQRVRSLKDAHPTATSPIPTDLATASGSGLDPHISVQAAEFQVARVANERGVPEDVVRRLVREHTQAAQFGILGEPVVNVLLLNLALDRGANR